MAYIWINPVTECMYESHALTDFLKKHGYKSIKTTGDWLNVVREKYRMAVQDANSPMIDIRCPKTKEVLDELGVTSNVTIPAIEPILIHCAREISGREDLQGEEKVVTTPCKALADMGNALNLPDTRFVPWNQFLQTLDERLSNDTPIDIRLTPRATKESPIPPGFFEDLEMNTVSLTGEEEIREYFQTQKSKEMTKDIQLVEILFCKHGCHNGDGL